MKRARAAFQFLASLLVLGGAGSVAWLLLKTAPTTEPEDTRQAVKIVRVIDLKPTDERIVVSAWGSVIPAREVTMEPQVSGRVIAQHESLIPGGRLSAGEELVRIDPADYEMALIERKAELEEAHYESEVERGRQLIAKREWEQLKADLPEAEANPSLALREPHLRRTEAMVAKAKNAIERAELDLKRTSVVAPFNSMVVEESVEIGQLLEPGGEICRLVGTDAFWVRATLPVADLNRIQLPQEDKPGSSAEIHLDTGNGKVEPWSGRVIRLLSDLEPTGRMARVLIEITDPLGLEEGDGPQRHTPLLLGSYVRVDIEAGRLEKILSIPRSALREGNRLWLVGPDNRLRIAEPEILWTRTETVLVPEVRQPGERLIVSELKSAPPGLLVDPQPLDGPGEAPTAPAK
ncbi:MAG: HlyD family efflux transporter periplasmic adaptor subunit [Akkermansiaceae bacterium]|nr:HlyD family efflux transporter periplasmic adaptor subunit [Akkermansiaceae bacterium]MCP5551433.1 HlyD family efflux transporter periplasmic adaptor subunit [Akkermansiaceae bacterium]